MGVIKENGGRPHSTDWIAKAEIMYWQQYKKELLKLYKDSKPKKLMRFRSGIQIMTGTNGEH
jgi:hypothetical protein